MRLRHLLIATVCLATGLVSVRAAHAENVEARPAYPTFIERPISIAFDGGFGAPTGYFGMTAGYTFPRERWAVEAGGGIGSTGYQAALQGKYYTPIFGSTIQSLTLQAGPSVGLLGKPLGTAVPHKDGVTISDSALYYVLWLHAGVGYEVRGHWGGFLRVSAGAMLNVHNNQAPLCEGVHTLSAGAPGVGSCSGMHIPLGPEVARRRVLPWFGFSYGYAF